MITSSANHKLLQDIYDLFQLKYPELGKYLVPAKKKGPNSNTFRLRFQTAAFSQYRSFIGFTHSEKRQELDRILARKERGWQQRSPGTTPRMVLENLHLRPMTMKDLAHVLEVTYTI